MIQGKVGRAGLENCENAYRDVGTALDRKADDVVALNAFLAKRVRKAVGPGIELSVGQPLLARHNRFRSRRLRCPSFEQRRQSCLRRSFQKPVRARGICACVDPRAPVVTGIMIYMLLHCLLPFSACVNAAVAIVNATFFADSLISERSNATAGKQSSLEHSLPAPHAGELPSFSGLGKVRAAFKCGNKS